MWLGVSIVAWIIFGCDLLIGIYRGSDRKKAVAFIAGAWLYLALLLIPLPGNVYLERFLEPFALAAFIPAILVSLLYLILLVRSGNFPFLKVFNGVLSKRVGLLFFAGFLLIYPLYRMREFIIAVLERFLFPFGNDPIMRHIGELQPAGFGYWWRSYGEGSPAATCAVGVMRRLTRYGRGRIIPGRMRRLRGVGGREIRNV